MMTKKHIEQVPLPKMLSRPDVTKPEAAAVPTLPRQRSMLIGAELLAPKPLQQDPDSEQVISVDPQ